MIDTLDILDTLEIHDILAIIQVLLCYSLPTRLPALLTEIAYSTTFTRLHTQTHNKMPSMGELAAPVMPSVQAKLAEITGPFNVVAKVTSEPKHADDVAKLIKDVAVLANSDEEEGTLT